MIKEAVNEKELYEGIQQGDAVAMLQLGNHRMVQGKYDEAVELWEKAAEAGRAGAAYNLARYYSGLDTGQGNAPQMQEWLTRLAYAHNDGWGMLQMGILMCGGTHQIWRRTIQPEEFTVNRNIEEGLRLIIQGVKQAEATTKDLTLYDYDAAAEIVRAYSGPLGIEVLKLALAYKTKARGMIPAGYSAMNEAAGKIINELQSQIAKKPTPAENALAPRVEVVPRSPGEETTRGQTRVMPAPITRGRTVARAVPPPNDAKRRDPNAGFGTTIQLGVAGAFLLVMGIVLALGAVNFEREALGEFIRLRVLLYGLLAVAGVSIGIVSTVYRWGAMGASKGIFILVMLGGLYSATVNTINERALAATPSAVWEMLLSAAGAAVMASVALGLLTWLAVRVYDHDALHAAMKAGIYALAIGVLGFAVFFVLWHVDHTLADILIAPFRSVPYVWAAILPGVLLLRWAEEA